jgi:hypothetical protein
MASYTTAALVEAELRTDAAFSGSTSPTLTQVTSWITEESAYIDHITADEYTQTTTTDEWLDYDGGDFLYLRHSPVISVSSLSYNKNDLGSSLGEDFEVKTAGTDYILEGKSGLILLPFTSFNPHTGKRRFKVTYVHGFSSTPSTVQKLATKLVVDRVLSSLLNQNVNEGTDGGSISVGSVSIVEPGAYGVGNYRRLKEDIEMLKKELAVRTGVYRY